MASWQGIFVSDGRGDVQYLYLQRNLKVAVVRVVTEIPVGGGLLYTASCYVEAIWALFAGQASCCIVSFYLQTPAQKNMKNCLKT